VDGVHGDPVVVPAPRELVGQEDERELRPAVRRVAGVLGPSLEVVEVERIADITSRLIVNRAALKTRPEEIGAWIERFRRAAEELSRAA